MRSSLMCSVVFVLPLMGCTLLGATSYGGLQSAPPVVESGDHPPPPATLDLRAPSDQGSSPDYDAYRADVAANLTGLSFLRLLDAGGPMVMRVTEGVTGALALGPFAARCATYATMRPQGNRTSSAPAEQLRSDPKYACRLATNRMEIMKPEVAKILATRSTYARGARKQTLARIASGEPITAAALACARELTKCDGHDAGAADIERRLGLPSSETPEDKAAFATALTRATSKKRVGPLRDRAREDVVRRMLAGKRITPVATGLYASSDDVKKNSAGMPLMRYRGVSVLVRVDDEPFCRSYMAYASASYEGGGRYGGLFAEGFDPASSSFLVSSCR